MIEKYFYEISIKTTKLDESSCDFKIEVTASIDDYCYTKSGFIYPKIPHEISVSRDIAVKNILESIYAQHTSKDLVYFLFDGKNFKLVKDGEDSSFVLNEEGEPFIPNITGRFNINEMIEFLQDFRSEIRCKQFNKR